MTPEEMKNTWGTIGLRYKSHPWHGIDIGDEAPEKVKAFIEMVPSDTVKYEIDKESGFLMVDRPQKFSNIVPALYGFIPQTYCDEEVAAFSRERTDRDELEGDGDPLDILVLTDRNITHGDLILTAIPVGGLRMIDGGEADDKIIAVMKGDPIYASMKEMHDFPGAIVQRLKHYFLSYKQMPGQPAKCEITDVYGREEAYEVIRRSQKDYQRIYGNLNERLSNAALDAINYSQSKQ